MDINDNHINYVEFKAKDLEKIKEFYKRILGFLHLNEQINIISVWERGDLNPHAFYSNGF
jgi:catechol-2,3-dioxygenase